MILSLNQSQLNCFDFDFLRERFNVFYLLHHIETLLMISGTPINMLRTCFAKAIRVRCTKNNLFCTATVINPNYS